MPGRSCHQHAGHARTARGSCKKGQFLPTDPTAARRQQRADRGLQLAQKKALQLGPATHRLENIYSSIFTVQHCTHGPLPLPRHAGGPRTCAGAPCLTRGQNGIARQKIGKLDAAGKPLTSALASAYMTSSIVARLTPCGRCARPPAHHCSAAVPVLEQVQTALCVRANTVPCQKQLYKWWRIATPPGRRAVFGKMQRKKCSCARDRMSSNAFSWS